MSKGKKDTHTHKNQLELFWVPSNLETFSLSLLPLLEGIYHTDPMKLLYINLLKPNCVETAHKNKIPSCFLLVVTVRIGPFKVFNAFKRIHLTVLSKTTKTYFC